MESISCVTRFERREKLISICLALSKEASGTIFVTSLVWRGRESNPRTPADGSNALTTKSQLLYFSQQQQQLLLLYKEEVLVLWKLIIPKNMFNYTLFVCCILIAHFHFLNEMRVKTGYQVVRCWNNSVIRPVSGKYRVQSWTAAYHRRNTMDSSTNV